MVKSRLMRFCIKLIASNKYCSAFAPYLKRRKHFLQKVEVLSSPFIRFFIKSLDIMKVFKLRTTQYLFIYFSLSLFLSFSLNTNLYIHIKSIYFSLSQSVRVYSRSHLCIKYSLSSSHLFILF
jgi:hypothetical protein